MRAVGNRQRSHACGACHFQIVGGVAHHQGLALRDVELAHQLEQHSRMRLGIGFIGAARRHEAGLQVVKLEVAVEAAAALAGGNGKQMLPGQLIQERTHSRKELHRVLALLEVLAVARDELGIAPGGQRGHRDAHRVVQAQPDDVRCALAVGHLEAELARRVANAFRDRRRRVDDRAVPVEDEEPVRHCRCAWTKALISAGSGDSSFTLSPLTGCLKASRAACKRSRCLSWWLSGKSPYLSSPMMGWPACARWTRIWCVRPVSSSTSSRLKSFELRSLRARVSAALPSSWTLTRRSPDALTYLWSDSRSSRVFFARAPRTTAR